MEIDGEDFSGLMAVARELASDRSSDVSEYRQRLRTKRGEQICDDLVARKNTADTRFVHRMAGTDVPVPDHIEDSDTVTTIGIDRGLPTLRSDERKLYDAIGCQDLVAHVTVKRSSELNKATKRKVMPPELVERDKEASKHFRSFANAMHPDTTDSLLLRLMVARVERNLISEALLLLLEATNDDSIDRSDLKERARDLASIVERLRRKGGW